MIKFMKFVPVQLTFFLILGILTGYLINIEPIHLIYLFGVIMLVFVFVFLRANRLYKVSSSFTISVFLISILIGITSITINKEINNKLHYSNNSNFKEQEAIPAIIHIERVLKPNLFYEKFVGEVLQFDGKKSIGKILINVKRDSSSNRIMVDDRFTVKSNFNEIKKPLNPYMFNYKKYLQNKQIHHQIYLNKEQLFKLNNDTYSFKGIAANVRYEINESLKASGFKNEELALINAMLLGQRNFMTKDLLESYSGAGAIHILAVSGLHIGIMLILLNFIFKPLHYLKNGKLLAAFLIILLLWIYALIAGFSASIVRAVTMFTALTIGMYLIKRSNVYNTLVVSMFFLLIFNPFYLFDVGFQLSYLAVFSIVWIQPKLYKSWKPSIWFLRKGWQLFTVSIAAQVGILPLSLYYFHQFPGLFFLSNLVLIPAVGAVLAVGILVIALSYFEVLPELLKELYENTLYFMNAFVKWVSSHEAFIIENITFSSALMLSFYLAIFVTLKWTEKRNFNRFILVLGALIIVQTVFVFEKYQLESSEEFIVFNTQKESVIGIRKGSRLNMFSEEPKTINEYILKPFLVGKGIENMLPIEQNKKLYKFKNEIVLFVDSLGFYNFNSIKPTMIVLQNSPKINLDRLLQELKPKAVIVDGTNYKSYVERWRVTCVKNKTPFHNTMQKGAFILK